MTIQTNQIKAPDTVSLSCERRFSFRHLASRASRLEQEQQYQLAGEAWEAASDMACHAPNRTWARARAQFCQAMVRRSGEPVSRSWTADSLLRGL